MTQFLIPDQQASWAGVSPGSNESAGRVKIPPMRDACRIGVDRTPRSDPGTVTSKALSASPR